MPSLPETPGGVCFPYYCPVALCHVLTSENSVSGRLVGEGNVGVGLAVMLAALRHFSRSLVGSMCNLVDWQSLAASVLAV